MIQYCEHCGKDTKGFKITINGEHDFMCLTCNKHSKYIPFVHPNRNEEYASIGILDFDGSHNKEYGRK
jgi:hypothetical protein